MGVGLYEDALNLYAGFRKRATLLKCGVEKNLWA